MKSVDDFAFIQAPAATSLALLLLQLYLSSARVWGRCARLCNKAENNPRSSSQLLATRRNSLFQAQCLLVIKAVCLLSFSGRTCVARRMEDLHHCDFPAKFCGAHMCALVLRPFFSRLPQHEIYWLGREHETFLPLNVWTKISQSGEEICLLAGCLQKNNVACFSQQVYSDNSLVNMASSREAA